MDDPELAVLPRAQIRDGLPIWLPTAGRGDSIWHRRNSSIPARRRRWAQAVSLDDCAVCSKPSQTQLRGRPTLITAFWKQAFPGSGLDITHAGRYSRCVYWSLVIFALASVAYAQNTDNPLAGDPKSADGGRAVFRPYCVPCHGVHGNGGRGPDLTLGLYAAGEKDSDLFRVIANGVPGTEMAGFGSDIREEDIWRVVSYIRSIAHHDATDIAGDRAKGEKSFWGKGGCGACHAVGRRGGHMGPDLTRVGEKRSRAYLRESVLEPSKDISPGYATITIVKRDGTKLTGVERGFDDFSAQLMDASGNYYSFLRSDLRSATRELYSLMPDNYSLLFKAGEIDDLLAYLVSLRLAGATR